MRGGSANFPVDFSHAGWPSHGFSRKGFPEKMHNLICLGFRVRGLRLSLSMDLPNSIQWAPEISAEKSAGGAYVRRSH